MKEPLPGRENLEHPVTRILQAATSLSAQFENLMVNSSLNPEELYSQGDAAIEAFRKSCAVNCDQLRTALSDAQLELRKNNRAA